jgi:hypothetical protein
VGTKQAQEALSWSPLSAQKQGASSQAAQKHQAEEKAPQSVLAVSNNSKRHVLWTATSRLQSSVITCMDAIEVAAAREVLL